MTFLPWKKKTEEKNAPKVVGLDSLKQINTTTARIVNKKSVLVSTTLDKQFWLDLTDWTEEELLSFFDTVKHVSLFRLVVVYYLGLVEIIDLKGEPTGNDRMILPGDVLKSYLKNRESDKAMYEAPVLSLIPGGYNARPVDLGYINNDARFREAILKPTTTFYVADYAVFACTLEDKRKLVTFLKRSDNKYKSLVVFWPGKYQSHAFLVMRGKGAMTRMMELLGPSSDDIARIERQENLKQIRRLRNELNELQSKVTGNRFVDHNEDWYGNNSLPGQD